MPSNVKYSIQSLCYLTHVFLNLSPGGTPHIVSTCMYLLSKNIIQLTRSCALIATFALPLAVRTQAQTATSSIGPVFVIDMENRNWTQPTTDTSAPAQIYGNAAAPYINSLVTPGNPNAAFVSYSSHYHHVLSTPSGANPSIHPSEPNYLWQESGTNFGVLNDNDPYGSNKQVQVLANYLAANPSVSGQNISGLLQSAGIPWKSYQEGIDLLTTGNTNGNLGGTFTSTVAPTSIWTVPLASFSGTSPSYTNPYNGSHQYNFACKHDGSLFFTATNGSTITTADTTPNNPAVMHYAPLEQLQADLDNNTVARYNLITPDQYNDMHTALSSGFTYHGVHYTGDLAQLAQGDNFLAIIIPRIMASAAFQNNGVIIIWTDETEGTNQNDFNHTLMEIVISPLAKGNAYVSTADMTHSTDLATLQKIFGVAANTPSGFLNDAANPSNGSGATDLSDLFLPGVIPATIAAPQESTPAMPIWAFCALGALVLFLGSRFLPKTQCVR